MKHQPLDDLRRVAVVSDVPAPVRTRRERLIRWALVLERQHGGRLAALHGTEHQPAEVRAEIRASNSPISVAFEDPALNSAGLAGDRYGDAKKFFGLTDWQLHEIVCDCHHGPHVSANGAARGVNAAIGGAEMLGWMLRLRRSEHLPRR
jgi:hypothetical protein